MDLKTRYIQELKDKLIQELGVENPMAVPRLAKVVIDMGVGQARENKELFAQIERDLAFITGQKPQVRQAKVAVSGFGVRKGEPVGLRVTLRGSKMYAFLEKLFSIVLPRLRDFRGVRQSAFDGRGNYTLGVLEHTIFPEIDVTKTVRAWGLGITFVTTAQSDDQAKSLLQALGMPFEKGEKGTG